MPGHTLPYGQMVKTGHSSSPQTPLLFNGCRSGEIFAIDLRSSSQAKGWKATQIFHDSAVTSLQVFKEEQYLMASDMVGKVGNTDLRPQESRVQGMAHRCPKTPG